MCVRKMLGLGQKSEKELEEIEQDLAEDNDGTMTANCSLTAIDISKPRHLFEQVIAMNRCENVKCLYDSECNDDLFCY
jgi:hypothetical protein